MWIAHGCEADPEDARLEVGTSSAPASIASRVLPDPPDPVRVSNRAPFVNCASTACTSRVLPTKELAGCGRFVFEIVFSGGNDASPSWKSATGSAKVFEPVFAEVAQAVSADQVGRRPRDQHLAAVTDRGDARGAMDVEPDVALVGHVWLAGVQAHPHQDRSRRQEPPGPRPPQRAPSDAMREGDEEGIALRVNLDPAVTRRRRRAGDGGARPALPRSASPSS